MKEYVTKSRITLIVDKHLSPSIIESLATIGIKKIFIEVGRNTFLKENTGLTSFISARKLGYDPVEIITFFIDSHHEDKVLNFIAVRFDFMTPGRGTLFSSEVVCLKSHPQCTHNTDITVGDTDSAYFFKGVNGLCCIVQRGEGDKVAKVALYSGASVPVTTYGIGSGVRDKLGLLRITIPAEKELINLIMSDYDIDSVMELIIVEEKLEQPGRGIVYQYPVKQGIVNTKISRGKIGQDAHLEQMISAIDSIKGGMEWRKSRLEIESAHKRQFLTSLMELTLICDEGNGFHLTKAAMENGAPGATLCRLKYKSSASEEPKLPILRELCKMIVSEANIDSVTEALEAAGAFSDSMHGILYAQKVMKAFTYIVKSNT